MTKFDQNIDELDDNALKEFHSKLKETGCYEGLLNTAAIDENDTEKLRDVVKTGVQGADYGKLKEIAPESIKKQLEAIENSAPKPVVIPDESDGGAVYEGDMGGEGEETKEHLIGELIDIVSQRKKGTGVPLNLRERYGQILTVLNEKHYMTYKDIEEASTVTAQSISKAIENYRKEHPIARPDDKVVDQAETQIAKKLTKKVTEKADKDIEDDMELAIHIRETYLKQAYMRGMSLREMVDKAVTTWFGIENIYNMVLEQERVNFALRERIKQLEWKQEQLQHRNRDLNGALTEIIDI